MYTSQPSSSSPSPCVSSSSISPPSSCEVCGDTVHSKQYGVPSCLGCIVFFRRAIQNKSEFRCWRNGTCSITLGTRCTCRCCRLTKCFEVGMKPEAVSHRDQLGPRDPRAIANQKATKQVQSHKTYSSQKVRKNDDVTAGDVNLIFKLGMRNAIKWANQFEPYRKLSSHDRKLVLSEYGIGFVLIDFAFEVSGKMGHGSFDENENEVDKIGAEQVIASYRGKNTSKHFRGRRSLANELIDLLEIPFDVLKIDDFELSVLKTLLLLSPSFPGRICCLNSFEHINKCLSDFMEHCIKKNQEKGPERFGEVILLLGSIRFAVKSFYNQTRIPGALSIDNFDPSISNIFVS